MTKKEVLEMLDDMEGRILRSNGFIAGFVTQGFILELIDRKRAEVAALEEGNMMGAVVATGMAGEGGHARIPIVGLQIVVDRYVEYLREELATSRKAAEWVERNIIRRSNRELVVAVCCDSGGRATYIDVVAKGTVNCCLASVVEIFKVAIISNAVNIILFHNHPCGDPTPSAKDEETTRKVREVGELLDIGLLDHIIIGSDGAYYSFMENNVAGSSPDGA